MESEAFKAADDTRDRARSISMGFEALLQTLGERTAAPKRSFDFDIVIVGSGYGGALAAAQFAACNSVVDGVDSGKKLRVCVLERGREYLAGMFPGSEAELPGHVRFNTPNGINARGRKDALLDLRIGMDVSSLVANGLGGGSLINAGVMLQPTAEVLACDSWPESLRNATALKPYFAKAEQQLSANGAKFSGYDKHTAPLKFKALDELARGACNPVPLSIGIAGGINHAGVRLEECKKCGDCATGCNHRAKNSLDQNALALAHSRGASIFTGANVLKIERSPRPHDRAAARIHNGKLCSSGSSWVLHVVHTDPGLRQQQGQPFPLTARRVVLAAGTFGSTEILLRSQSETLQFSPRLGQRFSTNGDMLAASYGQKQRVNAVASETTPFDQRNIGPSITGMIDLRGKQAVAEQIAIQEFAIPGALRRLFAESFTIANTFHSLGQDDPDDHRTPADGLDPCGVKPATIDNSQVFGLMARDDAAGMLELVPGSEAGEGAIRVCWPQLKQGGANSVFDHGMAALRELAERSKAGGAILPNPICRLLPDHLDSIVEIPPGPALTVHPLGGCGMGDDWRGGVVDDIGRVFDISTRDSHHEGLVVLDGSIIPCALGINPALTIAAVTLRAIDALIPAWSAQCNAVDAPVTKGTAAAGRPLPIYRARAATADRPTEIVIQEQLTGEAELKLNGKVAKRRIELTLIFEPQQLGELSRNMQRKLSVTSSQSRIRIFDPDRWQDLCRNGASEATFNDSAEFIAPVRGHMNLLDRKPSRPWQRIVRVAWAWACNRGFRDVWQSWFEPHERTSPKRDTDKPFLNTIRTFLRIANRQGAIRMFEYELHIEAPLAEQTPPAKSRTEPPYANSVIGAPVSGFKQLSYCRGSNPWIQMSQVKLTAFPGRAWLKRLPTLELDPAYYARHSKHLMELVDQRDQATALFEMVSFLMTIARILVTTHLWSFRKPDKSSAGVPRRLPGAIPGLPEPSIHELPVGWTDAGETVNVRLTRYLGAHSASTSNPVVMIHGFSANGTTFAHPKLNPSLAEYLWNTGRDIWVVDLRTSSGMPSCRHAWKFEDVARRDIPVALDYIHRATGQQLDVVTHCMGAAMFSMALLDDAVGEDVRRWVRRVVLSQIGPVMVFTPANIFRAYAVGYIEQAIGDVNFELSPTDGLGSQLLDRLLATVPYPAEEFRLENPRTPWKRTAFVATRHRMDAWFGCVFRLRNVDRGLLDYIDDMFGAINLRTTFQTIHFARTGVVTTRNGRNDFVHRKNLERWRDLPTLSIHGELNGLADIATLTRMNALMAAVNPQFCSFTVKDFGHHDCLIGRDAPAKVFGEIERFLDAAGSHQIKAADAAPGAVRMPIVQIPWLGPIVGTAAKDSVVVAADPVLGKPCHIIVAAVTQDSGRSDRYCLAGDAAASILITSPNRSCVHDRPQDADGIGFYDVDVPTSRWASASLQLVAFVYREPQVLGIGGITAGVAAVPTIDAELTDELLHAAVADFLNKTAADEVKPSLLEPPKSPAALTVSFGVASCQYPAGPLDGRLASASYEAIDSLLNAGGPDFLVLCGDQVYTDATAGLMDPTKADDRYQRPYEAFLRTRAVRSVFRRIPVYTMLDDHEIIDNWEPASPDVNVVLAKTAYLKFQRAAGPARTKPVGDSLDPMWYEREIAGLPFFFADTRTERTSRRAQSLNAARIMSTSQLGALKEWLTNHRDDDAPMFVVSPSILLPRRLSTCSGSAGALRSDAWDGFPTSLAELLAHIVDHEIHNVTFLSGDEHHSCVATVTLTALHNERRSGDVTIHSIHNSGLYSPYDFANGVQEELVGNEEFTFGFSEAGTTPRQYRCKVQTTFIAHGDGFTMIECSKDQQWKVGCTFHKASHTRSGCKTSTIDGIKYPIRTDNSPQLGALRLREFQTDER